MKTAKGTWQVEREIAGLVEFCKAYHLDITLSHVVDITNVNVTHRGKNLDLQPRDGNGKPQGMMGCNVIAPKALDRKRMLTELLYWLEDWKSYSIQAPGWKQPVVLPDFAKFAVRKPDVKDMEF